MLDKLIESIMDQVVGELNVVERYAVVEIGYDKFEKLYKEIVGREIPITLVNKEDKSTYFSVINGIDIIFKVMNKYGDFPIKVVTSISKHKTFISEFTDKELSE